LQNAEAETTQTCYQVSEKTGFYSWAARQRLEQHKFVGYQKTAGKYKLLGVLTNKGLLKSALQYGALSLSGIPKLRFWRYQTKLTILPAKPIHLDSNHKITPPDNS
jgi:hypothetical protein